MNREQYLAKRNELLTTMKAALEACDAEKAKETGAAIEKLDTDYADLAREAANLAALQAAGIPAGAPVNPAPAAHVDTEPEAEEKVYANAFAKFMMGQGLTDVEQAIMDKINAPRAAMTEADHSVLVPHTLRAGIWEEIGKAHPIIARLARTAVPGDLDILVETDSGDDAAWYDEETAVADGTTKQVIVTLKGNELAKAIPVSWKLKKMSIPEFLAYIAKKLADKMGNALAEAVMNGKGQPGTEDTFKGQPKGILTALAAEASTPQIITYTAADGIKYATLTSLMAKVKSGYLSGAEFYATNNTIWTQLATIVDSTGRPMFIPDVTNGTVGKLFGIPVYEEDSVADGDVVLANVAQGYVMNVNEDVSMYFEDHVKARTTDYMAYSLIDGMPITTKAFALLSKKSA